MHKYDTFFFINIVPGILLYFCQEDVQLNIRCACVHKSNSDSYAFTNLENRKMEQVLYKGVPVGGRGCGESVWEGEYSENTVYTCM
jgi:hypothetical protein